MIDGRTAHYAMSMERGRARFSHTRDRMPDCNFQSRLSAYHDGELDAETAAELKRHLPSCAACGQALNPDERVRQRPVEIKKEMHRFTTATGPAPSSV